MEQTSTYLKTVPFKELDKWYVSFYLNPFTVESSFELIQLKEVIQPRKDRISKKNYKEDIPVIKKISFKDGKIHLRDEMKTGMDLYRLSKGELLVSKINFHQGAVSVNEIGELVCSTHYQPYYINTNRISPEFLILTLRSNGFLNFVQYLRADGIKNEATYAFIGSLKIPLPPLEEQNRIVAEYNQKIQLAQQQEQEANNLEQEIEDYLMEKLDLKKLDVKENVRGLQLISFKNIDRWDILAKDMRILNGLTTSRFPLKKIGDVFSFAKRSWNKKKYNKETFRYIELGAIDTVEGITEIKEILTNKAPSRATQQVIEGDLLIGTTRPYLKRFVIIDHRYDGDICSSGFTVLEPNQHTELAFLKEFLMSYYGLEQLKNRMTGATYPAITTSELKEILVPFPPRFVQIEIASEIKKMRRKIKNLQDKAKQNREEALLNFEQEIFNS